MDDLDISNTEKTIIIGNQLTTDIMFGNMNNMVSCWVNKFE